MDEFESGISYDLVARSRLDVRFSARTFRGPTGETPPPTTEVGINSPRWRVSWMCQVSFGWRHGELKVWDLIWTTSLLLANMQKCCMSQFLLKEDFSCLEIGLCMIDRYILFEVKTPCFFFHRGRSTCMPMTSCLIEAQSQKKINKSWDFSCHFLSVIPWKFPDSHRFGHLKQMTITWIYPPTQ